MSSSIQAAWALCIGSIIVFGCQADPTGTVGPESRDLRPTHASDGSAITAQQTAFDPATMTGTARVIWHTVSGATSYRLVIYATSSSTSTCSVDSPEYGNGFTLDLSSVPGTQWRSFSDHRYSDQAGLPPGFYCTLVAANLDGAPFVSNHLTIGRLLAFQVAFNPATNTGTARIVWDAVLGGAPAVWFWVGIPSLNCVEPPVFDPELGFHVQPEPQHAIPMPLGSDQFYIEGYIPALYGSPPRCADLHLPGLIEGIKSAPFEIGPPPPNEPPAGTWNHTSASPEEGEAIAFDATVSDPDGDALSYDWDFGDGSGSTDEDPFHAYADDGGYEVRLIVTDGTDSIAVGDSVFVTNLPPVVNEIGVATALVPLGTSLTLTAVFGDAGEADTHLATIEWGDGTSTSVGTDFVADPATSPLSTGHTYATPGVYEIALGVTDDDGGSDSEIFRYAIVYDPSAGFVTGGGWIDYAASACPGLCGGDGVGRFGFSSKYLKGTSVPTGSTLFEFQAGALVFSSTRYDWLVVSGSGKRAQFKGYGTVNDDGSYGFLLTAIDGVVDATDDRFRIKIWDTTTGQTVFDNQWDAAVDGDASTALDGVHGGGSIVIHRKK